MFTTPCPTKTTHPSYRTIVHIAQGHGVRCAHVVVAVVHELAHSLIRSFVYYSGM